MAAETVAQQIVRALKRHKVECFFGQSLPSALVLAAEAAGIRQIAYRQENSGGAMADGFARVSGKVGIVTAQNGPAATLLVAPLAECMKASVPVIALVQEVERPQANRNAFQELDHFALFSAVSKLTRRIDDAKRVDDYVDAAFVAAASGRPGPAVLLLPADLLREPAVEQDFARTQSLGHWPLDRQRPADDAVNAAAKLIAEAKAPVIYAGGGVLAAGGAEALQALADAASLPVFTTNMGKGAIAETYPLACGAIGALTGPRSLGAEMKPLMDEADVVLLVGTRTNQNGTDSWRLLPKGARLIHIDVDPLEIGRNHEALRLVGDARETLAALREALAKADLGRRKAARPALEKRIAAAWSAFEEKRKVFSASNGSPVRPERVMAELQRVLTPETTVVADASYSSMWIVGQLRGGHAGARFLTPRGLAGLGWGVPMAMGVAIARPGRPVVAVAGDGGFAHNWAEIETMVRMKIPVVTVVLNNGVLGFQKDAETVKFGAYTSACHFAEVDHAAIARACGCDATRVSEPGDVGPALREALASAKPWLIEVMTDPDAHPALSQFAGTLDK
jgi:acetolactate synthase-1/2/3 large subunit